MLWPLTVMERGRKNPQAIDQSGYSLELDLFRAIPEPLMLLKASLLLMVADSIGFIPPDFVDREVTQDRALAMLMLANAPDCRQIVARVRIRRPTRKQ